jgi:opacity protein-like surface antigen
VQGGWVRITFADPQYGPRTGWVELRVIKVTEVPPSTAPIRRGPPAGADAAGAPAQPSTPSRARPAPRPRPSARVFGSAAFDRMLASESFDAITGSDTLPSFGAGVQGVDVWRRLFVEFSAEYSKRTGERVFVFNNEVFRLGIPVRIKQLPVDLVGGWRFPLGRVTPFAGGGATFLRYEEDSDFAEGEENIREWHPGFVALAGVETRIVNAVHVRVDFRYRRVDAVLGEGGVSAEFNENSLGGTGVSVKVVFGR